MSVFTSDVTVEPGALPLQVGDNGGSLTVDGTVAVSSVSGSVAVTGPLTDAQLRATPVPVSGTVTTTPSGTQNVSVTNAAGAAAVNIQDGGNSITVDGTVAVSNFPATQPVSGTVTVVQPTGTNLHVVNDASSAVIGHVIADSGSTTAVTGNVTVVQPTGTNLHVVVDSGTITTGTSSASTATTTRVATSSASTLLLAANVNRKRVIVTTETGAQNYVALGSAASSTNYSYLLTQTATLDLTGWLGTVTLARASGTGSVQVTELV